jgi:hypothetical protein
MPEVSFVSHETLRAMVDLLGDVPQDWIICGVTVRGGGRVEVFILDGMPEFATVAVRRHEFGHVNGWEH